MNEEAKFGFELRTVRLPLDNLLPLRQIKDPSKIARYNTILVSVREVGLIEPLMVFPHKEAPGIHLSRRRNCAGSLVGG